MEDNETSDVSTAFSKVIDTINSLSPQCPLEFQSDRTKVEFLRDSIVGHSWASGPISRTTSAKSSFNALVTALREILHLVAEESAKASTSRTLYQRYGRNPSHFHKHPPRASKTQLDGNFRDEIKPIGKD